LRDEASPVQVLDVEAERGRRQAKAFGDDPGRETVRATLDQHAKDRQSRLVREGAESMHGLGAVHHPPFFEEYRIDTYLFGVNDFPTIIRWVGWLTGTAVQK
jgi:hypothetical protein